MNNQSKKDIKLKRKRMKKGEKGEKGERKKRKYPSRQQGSDQ